MFRVDFSRTYILPEVEELSKDEEVGVRCIAMETIAYLASLLDEGVYYILAITLLIKLYNIHTFFDIVSKREKIIPLMLKFFEEALEKTSDDKKEMQLRKKACQVIGQVCHILKGILYINVHGYYMSLLLYSFFVSRSRNCFT